MTREQNMQVESLSLRGKSMQSRSLAFALPGTSSSELFS